MIQSAMLLIIIGIFAIVMLGIKLMNKIGLLQARVKELNYKLNVAKDALRFAKPVVGAACAASTNDNREARQKVYDRITRALE